jgi:hypothetical protein
MKQTENQTVPASNNGTQGVTSTPSAEPVRKRTRRRRLSGW